MSRLPHTPSLDHLKAQARALLQATRRGEAAALKRFATQAPKLETAHLKLADAQWVLAREYGFPSWPRLKAFVEAAVSTPLRPRQQATQQLADQLEQSPNSAALGRHFALMPLRDILAVREVLKQRGTLQAAVSGLLDGLKSPQDRVRFDCATALDHFADERCTEPLRELLSDPVPRVRRAALHSLSCEACKLTPLEPCDELTPTVLHLLWHDPSIRVRRTAITLLEKDFALPDVQQALNHFANDADSVLSREARQILRRQAS